ncbi:hypothetical protein DSM112329_04730 [Paraconexibacter sp. AEG42_29]|uniref:Tetratricopeptide repeat protein n=1 Tax=Paraconexibacter sp. AEG42_29 TaxID=2997339 RepID=A0AAU7B1P2_9ACTN
MRWRRVLLTGNMSAHYTLGVALFELGRLREAYGYFRYFCELAPEDAFNWCWLGRTAAALGDLAEARTAYERAIMFEVRDPDIYREDDDTWAEELLQELLAGDIEVPEAEPEEPVSEWVRAAFEVAGDLAYETEVWGDEDSGCLVIDHPLEPVVIDFPGHTWPLRVRSMVGRAPALHLDFEHEHPVYADSDALRGNLWVDGSEIWFVTQVPVPVDHLTADLVELLALGAATTALQLRADVADRYDLESSLPYDELTELRCWRP